MSMVHYWALDEASGATISDAIGSLTGEVINDASDTVATAPTGFGNHRDLTDSTPLRWIKLWNGTPDATYELTEWTITIRYRRNGDMATGTYGTPINQPGSTHGIFLYVTHPGTGVGIGTWSSTGSEAWETFGAPNVHDGVWRRWTMTGNGSTVLVYLDGTLLGSVASDVRLRPKTPIVVANWINGGSVYGQIEVDDIAIFDEVVSAATIASNDWLLTPLGDTYLPDPLPTLPETDRPVRFFCDLVADGFDSVRIPISSWQATLQVDRAAYAQVVIPAALTWVDAINDRSAGTFSVVAADASGTETTILSSPVQAAWLNRGATNASITMSGYFAGTTYAADVRSLRNIRSISITPLQRIRCDLDSSLRPGNIADIGGDQFVVGYINMYANATDRYMDVGERA